MNSYYINCINKAVNYIKNNLNKDISLNSLSESCGLSKFHIHQIFKAFTGKSLYDTIHRLKIENAAELLTSSSKTVTDIAIISGFSDTSFFSREFKNQFKISPSAWRKSGNIVPGSNSIISENSIADNLENKKWPTRLSASVENVEEFSIAYIRHTGAYAGDSALFTYLYNKLTTWAASKDLLNAERQNVVVYHDPVQITEESRSKISLGISVPMETRSGGDIGKMKLQGGDYLISRYSLKDDEYSAAWNQVYSQLLPQFKLKPSEGFSFELYPNDTKSEDRYSSIVDIYVPVSKI